MLATIGSVGMCRRCCRHLLANYSTSLAGRLLGPPLVGHGSGMRQVLPIFGARGSHVCAYTAYVLGLARATAAAAAGTGSARGADPHPSQPRTCWLAPAMCDTSPLSWDSA